MRTCSPEGLPTRSRSMVWTVHDLEHLFQRYCRNVVRFFVRLGFPREEARDLAQEVFVRVYKGMESYRGEAEWAYLETIARRIAWNAIREGKTLKRSGIEVSLDALPCPDSLDRDPWTGQSPPTREDELIEREERERQARRLKQAIGELPPKTRMCVVLRLGSLSYHEIQETLGITLDTVKARLNDARNLLRTKLREEPGDFDRLNGRPEV